MIFLKRTQEDNVNLCIKVSVLPTFEKIAKSRASIFILHILARSLQPKQDVYQVLSNNHHQLKVQMLFQNAFSLLICVRLSFPEKKKKGDLEGFLLLWGYLHIFAILNVQFSGIHS